MSIIRQDLQVQEIAHEFVRRIFADFFRRAGLLDDAFVDDDHAVSDLEGLVLIMGHEDRGEADPLVKFPEPAAEVFAHLGIQRAERFVEQQHFRLDGQRSRKGHPLALAAGELGRLAVSQAIKSHQMEQLIHHFIITTEGIDAPAGEVYFGAENPKGELGFYINSKGGGVPYRLKIRAPSFVNLSIIPKLLPGHMVGDVVTILGSIDMVFGECDR